MSKKVVWLVAALMFCMISAASAMGISPVWTQIVSVESSLTIQSNGQALMVANIAARPNVQKVTISSYLQRYENNSWVTIENWHDEYSWHKGAST